MKYGCTKAETSWNRQATKLCFDLNKKHTHFGIAVDCPSGRHTARLVSGGTNDASVMRSDRRGSITGRAEQAVTACGKKRDQVPLTLKIAG